MILTKIKTFKINVLSHEQITSSCKIANDFWYRKTYSWTLPNNGIETETFSKNIINNAKGEILFYQFKIVQSRIWGSLNSKIVLRSAYSQNQSGQVAPGQFFFLAFFQLKCFPKRSPGGLNTKAVNFDDICIF